MDENFRAWAQATFDKVAKALLKQGRPSARGLTSPMVMTCLYRGPDGCKCAIGHLIPDDLYSEDMEGAGVRKILNRNRALRDLLVPPGLNLGDAAHFLMGLQQAHDQMATEPGDFGPALKRYMLQVARRFGLDPGVLGPE